MYFSKNRYREVYHKSIHHSLLVHDEIFDFSKYFHHIVDAFALVRRKVEIKTGDKKNFSKVEYALLNGNTDVYDVCFKQRSR